VALIVIIDESTEAADGKTARMQADTVMDAFLNPHTPRPAEEWVGGEMARQLVRSILSVAVHDMI
jgi:Delta6-protoilludene synthase